MGSDKEIRFSSPVAFVAIAAGGASTLLGLVVLAGWYTHRLELIQILPEYAPMQFNTALGFVLCGIGLCGVALRRSRLAFGCSAVAGIIGALTLTEYVSGFNLGIDELLMKHYITVETSHAGRMAPNTALCLALVSATILLLANLPAKPRRVYIAALLAAIVSVLGWTAFTGYLSGAPTGYGWGQLTSMAVHTASGFILLGLGLLVLAVGLRSRTPLRQSTDPEKERRTVFIVSVLVVGLVTFTVSGSIIRELRHTAIEEKKDDLQTLVRSWSDLIASMAEREAERLRPDLSRLSEEMTLNMIVAANEHFAGIGETGEFVLARREGGMIVFLLARRHGGLDSVAQPVPFEAGSAAPMHRALDGDSGTLTGLDYRNTLVLSAFMPIEGLGWGIVAKMDMAEIEAPFRRATILAMWTALAVIVLGATALLITVDPLVRGFVVRTEELKREISARAKTEEKVRASQQRYWGLFEHVPVSLWEEDFSEVKTYLESHECFHTEQARDCLRDHPDIVEECERRVKVLNVNKASLALHNATNKEQLLSSIESTFTVNSHEAFQKQLVAISQGETQIEFEAEVKTMDGTLRNVLMAWSVAPGHEETYDRVLISMSDITERKLAEEKAAHLSSVLERSLNEIYIFDAQTFHFVLVNRGARDNLGYSVEELRELTPIDLKPQFTNESFAELVEPLRSGNVEMIRFTAVHRRKNRTEYPVEIHLQLMTAGDPVYVAMGVDITERERSESALRESEARYKAVVEDQTELICRYKPDGTITFVNGAYCEYFSKTAEELVGHGFTPLIPDEDQENVAAYFKSLGPDNPVASHEHRVIAPDGEIRWQRWTNRAILDESGNVVEFQGTGRDITEQKQAEKALIRSNRTLRMTSECNAALVRYTEEEELLNEICRITVEVGGYRMAWVGHAEQDDLKRVRPVAQVGFEDGYLDTAEISWKDDDGGRGPTGIAIRTGEPSIVKNIMTDSRFEPWRPDATKRGYQSSAAFPLKIRKGERGCLNVYSSKADAFDEDEAGLLMELAENVSLGLRGIRNSKDLAATGNTLQQTSNMLNNVLTSATEYAIVATDLELRIIHYNPAAERLFGHSAEESIGHTVREIHLREKVSEERLQHALEMVDRTGTFEYEVERETPEGNRRYLHSTIMPMLDESGKKTGYVLFSKDVTEMNSVKERLQKRSEELERSNADLQEFAYVASHDLQEPLRAISGFVQLLTRRYKGKLDDKADQYMEYVVDGAARMQQLLTALLEYSRIDAKTKLLDSVNLEETLTAVEHDLRVPINEAHAEITHDPLPFVSCDKAQLRRVMQNLISNAIKFRGDSAPQIHVSAEEHDDEWFFCVRDNGIGIESQYSERIFQIFQRLHLREEYPGNGVGLAICKKIVERHGGRIWMESDLGAGSAFFFSLPRDGVASKTMAEPL